MIINIAQKNHMEISPCANKRGINYKNAPPRYCNRHFTQKETSRSYIFRMRKKTLRIKK
jgi:hypothetical protein